MGADLVLLTDCPVKQRLGDGDPVVGSDRLYKLTKLRSQADTVARLVAGDGRDPMTATFQQVVTGPDGPVERELSVRALYEQTAILDELAPRCAGCPANHFDDRFGCVSFVAYPIPEAAEAWLARRIQPADSLGGWLLLKAIKDFGYDGRKLAGWRARGMLTGKAPAEAIVKKGFLSSTKVSTDQVLEAILTVGAPLQPSHCMMVLLFVGALRLDGRVPASKDDPTPLSTLSDLGKASRSERAARTALDLGPASDDDGIAAMQRLLTALYQSFLLGDDLWVDG